ncbi:hypothetical protein [Ralstonia mannitolilytica]|uniref:Uncharacterized protein n=1 Tax=Ralstonia mannitolilytica TaxID=105219 RepID=A0AAJ5D3A3_9RALS|nr:hypothetical protein [Ralstonia mannitolilytica]CAG2145744.1 hypothetical protein LMG6866_02947 [Ralstonia mannitolilytica]CAJ0728744.1 hypothetical protein R77592_01768 [Ralstonia mannitolilytica]SUD89421.1 Uncharacterised protein [Ralstonia mannitolilytica]SUD95346.1 Uncharacterised protein [Ralstonia mannitolilytica]SUD95800.1 Uncharacterised protein [Ralstonia mannitolilytica]
MNSRHQKGAGHPPGDDTYLTDVSETDEEGTTVREAEVRARDMSEVGGRKSHHQPVGEEERDTSSKDAP